MGCHVLGQVDETQVRCCPGGHRGLKPVFVAYLLKKTSVLDILEIEVIGIGSIQYAALVMRVSYDYETNLCFLSLLTSGRGLFKSCPLYPDTKLLLSCSTEVSLSVWAVWYRYMGTILLFLPQDAHSSVSTNICPSHMDASYPSYFVIAK